MKNYLWNMFANIKNGQMSGHSVVFQKRKKICEAFLKILWAEGFFKDLEVASIISASIKITDSFD